MTGWVIQALGQNPRFIISTVERTTMHSPNPTCRTCTAKAEMIVKGATSTLKGHGRKHSKVPCAMLASQSISERRAASSSTTLKLTPVSDDLYIIQFLPIYLFDSARAWLDHLSRNIIDSWEDLREIFTGSFQGTYMHPGNP
jgi:hypothetical protein